MGEQASAINVLESLQLLRNDSPVERKRGIMNLSGMIDDPRVLRVFEHLYENDPDSGVRQMAWRAINRQGPSIPAPGPVAPSAAAAASAPQPAPPPRNGAQQEPFLINPANIRLLAAHARAQTPHRGGLAFFLAALLLALAGVAAGWALPGWIEQIRLDRSGLTAAGEIIRLYTQADGDSTHYYASYRFPVEQASGEPLIVRTEHRLTESAYNGLSDGSAIEVTYLPGEPDQVRLAGIETPDDVLRRWLIVAAAGLGGAAILLLLVGLVRRGRAPRIKGRILWGEVVRAVGELDARGRFTVRLRYQFRMPQSKKMIVKQISRPRSDLDPEDIPGPGTPVVVYYRSETDHRLL
jgi:hypothetical protein